MDVNYTLIKRSFTLQNKKSTWKKSVKFHFHVLAQCWMQSGLKQMKWHFPVFHKLRNFLSCVPDPQQITLLFLYQPPVPSHNQIIKFSFWPPRCKLSCPLGFEGAGELFSFPQSIRLMQLKLGKTSLDKAFLNLHSPVCKTKRKKGFVTWLKKNKW